MNIFQKVFNKTKEMITQKSAKSMYDLTDAKDIALPLNENYNSDANLQAYADSSWVYICVSRIAQDIASLPIKLYKKSKGKKDEIESHPILDALSFVNNNMTTYDLIEWMVSSLELTGNTYCNVSKGKGKGVTTLFPYIPSLIRPVPSSDAAKPIKQYLYSPAGQDIPVRVEDMLHLKYYNPLKTGYILGMSTLSAIRYAVQTDREAVLWNFNSIKNGCTIEGVLKSDNPVFNNAEKRNEAIDSWNQRYSGKRGEKTALLFGGISYDKIGISQKDMEFLEQRKLTREEILAGFKVPPALVGIFEYANYANAEVQEKFYWKNGILPRIKKIESGLNEKFLPMFPSSDNLVLEFDISQVEALQVSLDNKIKNATAMFQMGVPYNKVAEALNLPVKEIEGGDVGYIPFSLNPIGGTEEPPTVPVKKLKLLTKLTPEQKEIKWLRFVKLTDKHEGKIKPIMKKYFTSQEKLVQANLGKQKTWKNKAKIDDIFFNFDKETDKLVENLTPIYKNIIVQQAIEEIDNFNFDLSFDISSKPIINWIKTRGLDAAKEINETTVDALRRTLAEGISQGESTSALSKRIAEVYDQARDYRTDRIARTETIAASNEANIEVYRQSGVTTKKGWLTAGDETVRESHIKAGKQYDDSGAIELNEDFQLEGGSGQAPGEIDAPEESINCRCTVYPVIEK
ncbi:MAG TPA: phage portal protein [Ignavibacteriales bacterium]|nr:phage portal protein [Ignavibacteriales bacterium]